MNYFARLREIGPAELLPQHDFLPALLRSNYELSLNVATPLIFGLVYLFVVGYYNRRRPSKHNYLKGRIGTTFVLLHNVALCIYSAWTFINVAPEVYKGFMQGYRLGGLKGLRHSYCDSDSSLFTSTILPYGYLFYLSKFYEVVDTAIILAKGSKVKLLQSYHHFGAMLAMFAGIRYQSIPILYFCVFNSFIHTIMYCYYAFAVMKLPFPRILKRSLTALQITQFILGTFLATTYLFLRVPELAVPDMARQAGKCLTDEGARFAVLLNIIYLTPLTALFLNFYRKSYKQQSKSKTA